MTSDAFRHQVSLLVQVLPFAADEECFALKGGTAINLFVRDLPRLSVDIDLTYLPLEDRGTSLTAIDAAMQRIAKRISAGLPRCRVQPGKTAGSDKVTMLNARTADAIVKLEVTPVLRGCVYQPEIRSVSTRVEEQFGFVEMQLVSFADLYAGKIVAALDRQHPRDLFDVRDLLRNEGIDDALRQAFIVYMLSHNRPMGEVLAMPRKDISQEYETGFLGMTEIPVGLDELLDAREQLVSEIVGNMPQAHKEMLVSFESGEPDWSLLDVPNVADLPAIQWRMENLAKLDQVRRARLVENLRRVLQML